MIEFVDFAFSNINKALLGPFGAVGAKSATPGPTKEYEPLTLDNLV
jgi:hypothetical protein